MTPSLRAAGQRCARAITGMVRETAGAARVIGDRRSLLRYAVDIALYRVLRLVPIAPRPRTITLRDGSVVTYRLNRGDIQTVREVWISESYRIPFSADRLGVLVDLGANIGLTSVYLARRHGCTVLAVEPSPANAALARRNLARNGVAGELVQAAIGPVDTMARFAAGRDFNTGHVGDGDIEVRVISMPTLLARLAPGARIDLLKVDIEGAEEELFSGDLAWLDRVDAVLIELHPTLCDSTAVTARLLAHGFRHLPGGSVHAMTTDAFIRDRSTEGTEPRADATPVPTPVAT
jgi:FkbM family methyltransferase